MIFTLESNVVPLGLFVFVLLRSTTDGPPLGSASWYRCDLTGYQSHTVPYRFPRTDGVPGLQPCGVGGWRSADTRNVRRLCADISRYVWRGSTPPRSRKTNAPKMDRGGVLPQPKYIKSNQRHMIHSHTHSHNPKPPHVALASALYHHHPPPAPSL